jgi:hypothetical protein
MRLYSRTKDISKLGPVSRKRNSHVSFNVFGVFKARRPKWAGNVGSIRKTKPCASVRKTRWQKQNICAEIMKILQCPVADICEHGIEYSGSIKCKQFLKQLTQYRVQRRACVNTSSSIKVREFLSPLSDYQLLRNDSAPWSESVLTV